MKYHHRRSMHWRILGISLVLVLACGCSRETAYEPPSKRGPLTILLSGIDGANYYRSYAADVAQLGYYVVLLDGRTVNEFQDLRNVMERAQSSAKALPGKAVVIGFSLGGGHALTYAAGMPDLVSAIVAYYPRTSHIKDMHSFVADFKVPILVLAGGKDTFRDCCLIESMRAMERCAKEAGKPFELVAYPNAGHVFNIVDYAWGYSAEDSADAWKRTIKLLSQYHPLR